MSFELISSPCIWSLERRRLDYCRFSPPPATFFAVLCIANLEKSEYSFFARRQSLPFEAAASVKVNIATRTPGVTSTAANRREKKMKHT